MVNVKIFNRNRLSSTDVLICIVTVCTGFEIIDGAILHDGKLKVLESDSH